MMVETRQLTYCIAACMHITLLVQPLQDKITLDSVCVHDFSAKSEVSKPRSEVPLWFGNCIVPCQLAQCLV